MGTVQGSQLPAQQEIRSFVGKVETRFASPLIQERLQAHRLASLEQLFAHKEDVDQR